MMDRPTLRTHSFDELVAFNRSAPCPECNAPTGAPCADRRSWDKDLYGVRVHGARRATVRALHATVALVTQ